MNQATLPRTSPGSGELHAIYDALSRGQGREQVNDDNVDALIAMARQRGASQLEYLLREWRSPCGEDADAPTLAPGNPPPR